MERLGAEGDALSLAMRIVAAAAVDICAQKDCDRLRELQEADGGFPSECWIYKYGATGMLLANRGLTTAIALQAVRAVDRLEKEVK